MADVITLKEMPDDFGEIYLQFKPSLRQRQQARRYANESYLASVKLFKGIDHEIQVKSNVFRSQRKNEDGHRVFMSVKPAQKQITDALCSCKAGIAGECAHVVAVFMKLADWILQDLSDVPSMPACTSVPQQWDKPRGGKIQPEPVSTMVIGKPGNTNRKKRPLVADFLDNRKIQLLDSDISHLQSLKGTPLSYLATKSFQTVITDHGPQNTSSALSHQMPLIQPLDGPAGATVCGNLVYPKQSDITLGGANNLDTFKPVEITHDEAIALEQNTRDQAQSELWHAERLKRITASNFGRFMVRKAAVTQKFVDSVIKQKKFTSAATSYGSSSEKLAINMYRKQSNCHVHECGFIVNPSFPFIGATPAGKVCDNGEDGILEVKCPFSIRDMKIAEALESENLSRKLFLEKNGENISVKKGHQYWYQIQGQLLVSGANFCDFVTYTRQDLLVLRIFPDKSVTEAILNKMLDVYLKFIVPK